MIAPGPSGRSIDVSRSALATAAAITGEITDPRELLAREVGK